MSTNVDQRSKGQPGQVLIGAIKDVMKDEDQYLQPPHQMRPWSDETSNTTYGNPSMSTAGVSESFFQNFYPPNMTYPFMSQGVNGSEGSWSNGTDTMFGMGYDYNNVYGGFGFPFNNWDYNNDYWGTGQAVRKHPRSYTTDERYYPTEMMPPDVYGIMNGAVVPPESQEPIGTVEQGIRAMVIAPSSCSIDAASRNKGLGVSQPVLCDMDSPHIMSPPHSQCGQSSSSVICGAIHQAKKTSWAAIASQPARPQQQMRLRTIPRVPVNPNRPQNMDIGTWDGRCNSSKAPLPPPQQSSSVSLQPRQGWAASSSRSHISRQIQPYCSSECTIDLSSNGSDLNSNNNSSGNNSNNNSSGNNSNNNSSGNNSNNNSSGNNSNLNNHSLTYSNDSNVSASTEAKSAPEGDTGTTNGHNHQLSSLAIAHPVLDHLKSSNLYNPKEFNLNSKSARFFIIKSYSEDDIHRSIKYSIWCSTEHGNKRLDLAFRDREGKGPVYLIYSVNGSGHFCGIAQMMSPVDYSRSAGVWAQDKWKGQFSVKWVYVKDVPNSQLRHVRLENNENKPVTNSRDTQEVPPEKGKQVLHIVHSYKHTTSIFDDFIHYEKRQEQDASSGQQPQDHHAGDRDQRGEDRDQRGGDRNQRGGDRNQRGGDRDQRGVDRDQRAGDRDQRGMDRGQRGGEKNHRGWNRGEWGQRGVENWDQRGGDQGREDRNQRGMDSFFRGDRDRVMGQKVEIG